METQEKLTKLLNTDIIAVEVPKNAKEFTIVDISKERKALHYIIEEYGGYSGCFKDIPNNDFELLGEATEDEISFDVEPYVESNSVGFYKDYSTKFIVRGQEFKLFDKNNSFRSLLQASGLNWVNEYQNDWDELCTWGHGDFSKDGKTSSALYFEAERKKIKGKLIFLKIIK